MFENITAAPADPILGLADLFRADDRPEKINLGIGVYKDETGKTPVLTSVKKAEQYLLENETTKTIWASMVFLNLVAAPGSCCSVKAMRLSLINAPAPRRHRAVPVRCVSPQTSSPKHRRETCG